MPNVNTVFFSCYGSVGSLNANTNICESSYYYLNCISTKQPSICFRWRRRNGAPHPHYYRTVHIAATYEYSFQIIIKLIASEAAAKQYEFQISHYKKILSLFSSCREPSLGKSISEPNAMNAKKCARDSSHIHGGLLISHYLLFFGE